ncbi:MAG: homoserine dehydrogenase [Clostridia bacterium]|nr:homoserine dehydrogenase [Clostridia bacterium]
MISIAILGFGVVGGGVAAVLDRNAAAVSRAVGDDVRVKYILDLREFPDSPYADRVVHDYNVILDDPDVTVVAETMGGAHPAFEFSVAAMQAGKSVVTSNKEVVATYGIELCKAARDNGVFYLFEASVGGGIPLIRSIRTSLSGDVIDRIDGIMNGTTNYILTKMKNEGADFAAVLSDAQRLGYAEKNPSADVDGIDTQRKITILAALATGLLLRSEEVYAETMTGITAEDFRDASLWGGTVKLIGSFRRRENGIAAWVSPAFVPESHPLARVDDVYNAVSVCSPVTGDVMYYGRGAGRFPTAGAVVSDIVAAASGAAEFEAAADWQPAGDKVLPFGEQAFAYYVRTAADDVSAVLENARLAFGSAEELRRGERMVSFVTAPVRESEASAIFASGAVGRVLSRIRIFG